MKKRKKPTKIKCRPGYYLPENGAVCQKIRNRKPEDDVSDQKIEGKKKVLNSVEARVVTKGAIASSLDNKSLLGNLYKGQPAFNSIRQSKPPTKPDKVALAYYDTLKPGDLIRKVYSFSGSPVTAHHYAVYLGKNPKTKEHMIGHNTGVREKGTLYSKFEMQPIRRSHDPYCTDFERVNIKYKPYSQKEVVKRAKALAGNYTEYGLFSGNCEHVARAIVQGKYQSTQIEGLNPVAQVLGKVVVDDMLVRTLMAKPPKKSIGKKGILEKLGEVSRKQDSTVQENWIETLVSYKGVSDKSNLYHQLGLKTPEEIDAAIAQVAGFLEQGSFGAEIQVSCVKAYLEKLFGLINEANYKRERVSPKQALAQKPKGWYDSVYFQLKR